MLKEAKIICQDNYIKIKSIFDILNTENNDKKNKKIIELGVSYFFNFLNMLQIYY